MSNASSATAEAPAGWSVNPRGYISGGSEDTPVFLDVKKKFNAARTRQRNKIKRSSRYGLPSENDPRHYFQPVAIFGDPGFNKPEPHPIKES